MASNVIRLPKPCNSDPNDDLESIKVVIPAGDTVDVDTNTFSTFLGVFYELTMFNEAENKYLGFEINANRKGSEVCFSVYGKVGDQLARVVNVLKDGTDSILRITNSESFAVTVCGNKTLRSKT